MKRQYTVIFDDGLDRDQIGSALRAIGMIRGVFEIERAAPIIGNAATEAQCITYRLKDDAECRRCHHPERCGPMDHIPAKEVWKNMETENLVTFMADGHECYLTDPVEEEKESRAKEQKEEG